jgi:hypothetical protein
MSEQINPIVSEKDMLTASFANGQQAEKPSG